MVDLIAYRKSENVKHLPDSNWKKKKYIYIYLSSFLREKSWRNHVSPVFPPRCCAGWPLRVNHAHLRAHPRFLWKSFLQTRRYHYSHPRSILCHLHEWQIVNQFLKRAISFVSVEMYPSVRFWSHRSRSCQSLPCCSSWWAYTSPRRRWWRAQTMSLLWLQEMSKTEKKKHITCYELLSR